MKSRKGENRALPRFIKTNLGIYWKAVMTHEFVYYCNYREGDENANVIIYRRSNLEILSNNYFANCDLFSVLLDGEYCWLSPAMRYNVKALKEHNET